VLAAGAKAKIPTLVHESNAIPGRAVRKLMGKVDCVMVCLERSSGDTKFYFFDEDWKLKRLNIRGKNAPEGFTIPKPSCMDEMFKIAAKLSKGMPFVRVDLYQSNDQIYFGELTFFPDSGFDGNLLSETDEYFGSLIDIGKVKK
jgi:hypothetical protein